MASQNQLHLWPEETQGGRLPWSVTRDKRLRTCARRYYLYHYGIRAARAAGPADEHELTVLKQLRNRYMWVGEIVHELIELALSAWRRGENVPVESLVERGTRRMRAQYAESLQGVYRERPSEACGLVEHEYREELSRDEWKAQRDRMATCVRNFFALPLVSEVRAVPSWRWLALESGGSFELDGATVIVKPDFAWRNDADEVVLVDWKTGRPRPDDERLQLAVYAAYATRAWGARVGALRALVVYLESAEVVEVPLDAETLAWGEQATRDSIRAMRELAQYTTEPLRFALTEDAGACALCAFKRLCGR